MISPGALELLQQLLNSYVQGSDALQFSVFEYKKGSMFWSPRPRRLRILARKGYIECVGERNFGVQAFRITPKGLAFCDMLKFGDIKAAEGDDD